MSRSPRVDPEKADGLPPDGGKNSLDDRIRQARARLDRGENAADAAARNSGVGYAMRAGTELVAALLVGLGIGYGMDRWLGTGPWLLVLFFFIGGGAGIVNVWRVASGQDAAVGYKPVARATAERGRTRQARDNEDENNS